MPSHVTRNALDDPKNSEMFCTLFYKIFGPNQMSLSLKMGNIWPI